MTIPKVAICSIGLGRASAGHTLQSKLRAARAAGFDGVELAMECLEHHAAQLDAQLLAISREEGLLAASKDVRKLSDAIGLKILSLQPFQKYDALRDSTERLAEAGIWINCIELLGADWLQVPTSLFPATLDELDISDENIVRNMRLLSDEAAKKGVKIGYEAPSWGIAFQRWQDIDRVIRKIDRPNVQQCIDTYHIGSFEWGDPESPQTGFKRPDGDERLDSSLSELKASLASGDIGYFQLSDACAVDLSQKDYPVRLPTGAPPRMIWSRNCRVNPCDPDHGSLFPAVKMAQAVFDTGYRGWCSIETFHSDHWATRDSVPREWAERSMTSWKRIVEGCNLR